jgi:tRNA dimethylallyltransferase
MQTPPPNLIVIAGPTSSGKSELAVKIAKKIGGEIISADSRQVYRGLNIGTGKVEGEWQKVSLIRNPLSLTNTKQQTGKDKNVISNSNPPLLVKDQRLKIKDSNVFVYKKVLHHCIDFVNPKKQYTVNDFKKDGQKAIEDIYSRGKIPIICGGTGHYIDALIFDQNIPEVPPDEKFRKKMEKKSAENLFLLLSKKDPARASNIDRNNKRRLIRALEIIHHTKKPVPYFSPSPSEGRAGERLHHDRIDLPTPADRESILSNPGSWIAVAEPPLSGTTRLEIILLTPPRQELYQKIEKRLIQRVKMGMVEEVLKLHQNGLSWKRMESLGLEYRHIARFLQENKNVFLKTKNSQLKTQFLSSSHFQTLLQESKNYSKRQETWFRKYKTAAN